MSDEESFATLVQGTQWPFRLNLVSNGDIDFTTVTGVDIYVHRGTGAVETWVTTILGGRTASAMSVTYTCTPSGLGSVTIANERLRCRLILHFASGPDLEMARFILLVDER